MDKTELTERWHEVCYFLHQSISPYISEELFEQKVFQVLEKMGWSSFRKEIQPKQSIQVGSNSWIIPDIRVKSLEKNFQFVVEVKKPSANIEDSSHKNQLFSYMRMLKSEFGLLIGSNIKIYYDGALSDSEAPVLLSQFQFDESSEDGISFIRVFSKDTYSENQLKLFTEGALANIQTKKDYEKILNLVTSHQYIDKVKELIESDLKNNFNDQTISKALSNISINIFNSSLQKLEISRTTPDQSHQDQTFSQSSLENNKHGVINTIIKSITTKSKTLEEILAELVELFPDRLPNSMMNTIKAQLGGNSPLRIEKERNIQVRITIGDDNIKRYSLSEIPNIFIKNNKIIESHIEKSFGMNKEEFTKYLADKYISDDKQKEIFLNKNVWLKIKLNYIGGLILKLDGKDIFAPKDIRDVIRAKVIPSLSEISDNQLSGCLLTQDVSKDAPNPKWHNGYPCLEKVGDGKYKFIGF